MILAVPFDEDVAVEATALSLRVSSETSYASPGATVAGMSLSGPDDVGEDVGGGTSPPGLS